MKILITGANGFLGSWLLERLLQEGHEVSVLLRQTHNQEKYNKKGVKVFCGDITQSNTLSLAVQDQQLIYHLAGYVAYSRDERESLFRINAQGTENILKQASQSKVQRVLISSSVVAVGASFKPEVLNEDSPYTLEKYHLSYHESKREAETIMKKYVAEGKLDGVIVNPSTIYGAGDASKSSRSTQVKVAQGKLRFYPPGGASVVAVEDVIDGMIKAMEKGRSGERYILAGENLTLKDVFSMIAECAGVDKPALPLPPLFFKGLACLDEGLHTLGGKGPLPAERSIAAIMYHWYDSTKAKMELGYTTRPAMSAIAESVQWMKENKFLVK
jgi:dihydroflavonol-4-reductase